MEDILDQSSKLLKPGGKIVVTAVTTGTADRAARYFIDHKNEYDFLGYQAAYTRLRPVAKHFLFKFWNPVYLWWELKK